MSACESGSIKASTKRGYDSYRVIFEDWVKRRRRSTDLADLEANLLNFMDIKLESQEPVTHAEKTFASVVFAIPGKEARDFPRVKRALVGYRKLVPPVSRYPLAEVLVASLVGALVLMRERVMAVMVTTSCFAHDVQEKHATSWWGIW